MEAVGQFCGSDDRRYGEHIRLTDKWFNTMLLGNSHCKSTIAARKHDSTFCTDPALAGWSAQSAWVMVHVKQTEAGY